MSASLRLKPHLFGRVYDQDINVGVRLLFP
jgi:hypothetical protein